MALPEKLFAPTGSIYKLLAISGSSVSTYRPVFKYVFSQASGNHKSTFPCWFNPNDSDGNITGQRYDVSTNNTGSWRLCNSSGVESANDQLIVGQSDYIKIKCDETRNPDGVNLLRWSQWGQDSQNVDLLNRSALLGVMSNGMFPEKLVEDTNYTIHPHYTYRAYRLNMTSNGSAVTLTLPDPAKTVQRTIQVYILNASQEGVSGSVTISRNGSELINGSGADLSFGDSGGVNQRAGDNNKPIIFHTDGTNWYTSTNVGYDHNDDLPVYTIRRMTQSVYNALGSTDPNTLYVIE